MVHPELALDLKARLRHELALEIHMLPTTPRPRPRGQASWFKLGLVVLVLWVTIGCWWLLPRSRTQPVTRYDAVVVPGGGLNEDGTPYEFVRARLDAALRHDADTQVYIVLSRGTTHKPPPRDAQGFAVDESVASARYLVERGVEPSRVLQDTWSVDTVGNVAFARLMLVEPRGWRRLHVVTSEFHMPRTKALFEWIFGLTPKRDAFELSFEAVAERGMAEEARAARAAKEAQSLVSLRAGAMAKISDLAALHRFVFQEHRAYGAASLESAAAVEADRAKGALASTY